MRALLTVILIGLIGLHCLADDQTPAPDIHLRSATIEMGSRKVSVALVVFSAKEFSIRVIDNAGESDSARFSTLASAMESSDCVAGCNGGFFGRHPFSPVGGMRSGGHTISEIDPNTWMKGLLVVRSGQPSLEATDSFHDTPDITDLLQSGSRLVRAGKSETDNSRTQVARRTFICRDNKGVWAIGTSERCTLLELAAMLKSPEITAILDIQEALNFDGGPSTGLWLKRAPENFYIPEKWPVRSYIGILPRTAQ